MAFPFWAAQALAAVLNVTVPLTLLRAISVTVNVTFTGVATPAPSKVWTVFLTEPSPPFSVTAPSC